MKLAVRLGCLLLVGGWSFLAEANNRIYLLQRHVCCARSKEFYLTKTGVLFHDWEKLVKELSPLFNCNDVVSLDELKATGGDRDGSNSGRTRRGSSQRRQSLGDSMDVARRSSSSTMRKHRIFISREATPFESECIRISIEIPLAFRLNREFDLDYITAYDFDQLSTSSEVTVTISASSIGGKLVEKVLDTSEYLLTPQIAEAVPDQLFDNNSVDAWAHRGNDKFDKFRRLLQYLVVTGVDGRDARAYTRNMSMVVYRRMIPEGAFAVLCGKLSSLLQPPDVEAANQPALKNFLPSFPEGVIRASLFYTTISQLRTELLPSLIPSSEGMQESCSDRVILKVEFGKKASHRPQTAYLIQIENTSGSVKAVTGSMAFSDLSQEDSSAIALSVLSGLKSQQTATLAFCSDEMKLSFAEGGTSFDEFFNLKDFNVKTAEFETNRKLRTDRHHPYCLELIIFELSNNERTTAPFSDVRNLNLITMKTHNGRPVNAMPFWNVRPRQIISPLIVDGHGGDKLSLEEAFAGFASKIAKSRGKRSGSRSQANT